MASPLEGNAISMVQLGNIYLPVAPATQLMIANTFWATITPGDYEQAFLQLYSQYYKEQCMMLYHSLGADVLFLTHEGIIQLAQEIQQGQTQQQVVQIVEDIYPGIITNTQFNKADILNGVVNFVARLLLMVDVGQLVTNRIWTGRSSRSWDQGTIHSFIADIFPVRGSNRHNGIQLDTDFNARNLDVIGGLKVELTTNLLDHLRVVNIKGKTTVMIFYHASFLKNQQHLLFPEGFVDETLQTLALLFPKNKWYKKNEAWYYKYFKSTIEDLDAYVLECGPLTMTDIDEYQFWHDRLVQLKWAFDQEKPRTLRQWWNDRREGTQWYALWVVVGFTIFFGLVQSIEGALQIYKAYHP